MRRPKWRRGGAASERALELVGEISFLTGQAATANVIACAPLRCLVWKCRDLDRLKTRKPEVFNALYAAIGKDLALKTAAHNLTLAEV